MEGLFSGLAGKVRHSSSSIGVSVGEQSSMFANLRSAAIYQGLFFALLGIDGNEEASCYKKDKAQVV